MIKIPVSLGELYDKISILRIKEHFIEGREKFANIAKELLLLEEVADENPIDESYQNELMSINKKLWNVEDNIRILDSCNNFGPEPG